MIYELLEEVSVNNSLSKYTIVPAKSDSDVVFCSQLLSKTLTCTLHIS